MQAQTTTKVNPKTKATFVRNFEVLEHIDPKPDSYVDLHYSEYILPDYIRVSARNRHPHKTIQAYFYIANDKGGRLTPSASGDTIKARLKPSETLVVHFAEKKDCPRLFLFNASFAD
jgi:hypothetical protein